MGLNKKLLIGSVIGLVATTVVIGTAVGINNQKTNSISNNQTINSPNDPNKEEERIDLANLAKSINQENILIKQSNNDPSIVLNKQNLYAFNITTNQLSIDQNKLQLPQNINVSFDLNPQVNNVKSLNNGKLIVEVTLKDETSSEHKTTVEIDGFKTVDVQNEFKDLFEDKTNFVLSIDTNNNAEIEDSVVRFTNLTFLNETNIPLVNLSSSKRARRLSTKHESNTKTRTGLTYWFYEDNKKKNLGLDITISGEVKLAKISGNSSNNKAFFHLVAQDENNKIKLTKGSKEVLVSEIKTTNLLADDISVVPIQLEEFKRQKEFINALKNIKEKENKYLTNKKDPILNRELYVDLNSLINSEKDPSSLNKLFVKPHITKWPKTSVTNLGLNLEVSFGQTKFNTAKKEDLNQLKSAGFKFGLFTKKLSSGELVTNTTIFKTKKEDFEKYFKKDNYEKFVNKPTQMNGVFPAEFSLNNIELNEMLDTNLVIKLEDKEPKESQNWLAFVNYSYVGIKMDNVSYTPSISLIHIETNTPVM